MKPEDLGVFAQVLQQLQLSLQPGMTLLRPTLMALMGILLFVEGVTVVAGIIFLHAHIGASLTRLVLRTACLLAIFWSAPAIMTWLVTTASTMGLMAGGNVLSVERFLDPGAWLSMGFSTGQPILDAWAKTGIFDVVIGMVYFVAWGIMILAFVYMGFSLFVLQLQMTICLVGAQFLLCFAHSRFTSWIARGAMAYPVNMAFRFFFKAMIASIAFAYLRDRAMNPAQIAAVGLGPQVQSIVLLLIMPVCFAVLFWQSNAIAGGLLQGVPTLGVGHFLQAAVGGAVLAGGASAAGGAILSGAGGALSAGARTGLAARTAYQMGSATTIGGPLAQVGGGVSGVITAGANALASGAQRMLSPSIQSLQQTMQAGRQAGWVHSGGTLPAHVAVGGQGRSMPAHSVVRLQQTLAHTAHSFGNTYHDSAGLRGPS